MREINIMSVDELIQQQLVTAELEMSKRLMKLLYKDDPFFKYLSNYAYPPPTFWQRLWRRRWAPLQWLHDRLCSFLGSCNCYYED